MRPLTPHHFGSAGRALKFLKRSVQALSVLALAASLLPAESRKIARDLGDLDPQATVDVLIQFTEAPTGKHHEKVTQHGGTYKADFGFIKGGLYSIPASALKHLEQDPDVVYISPDRAVTASLDYTQPTVGANLALQAGFDGSGVTIALIDSGLQGRPDLNYPVTPTNKLPASRILYSESEIGGLLPGDDYGHGTHVSGVLAGNGYQSSGTGALRTFRGIAPNANLVSFRVLDANGNGTDSYVIKAIQNAINLKSKYNIKVMNISLGRPVFESYTLDPLCQAVEQAWRAGITVVVAAGNSGRDNSAGTNGYSTITAPGNDPFVITVGGMKTMGTASRTDDLVASYSSKGPSLVDHIVKPDLVAPGNRVISLIQAGSTTYKNSSAGINLIPCTYYSTSSGPCASGNSAMYYKLSGTSMATPVVSGAAALMLQKDPTLTPDQGASDENGIQEFPGPEYRDRSRN